MVEELERDAREKSSSLEELVLTKPAHSSLAWYWNEDKRRGEEHVQVVHPFHVIVMNMVDFYVDWKKLAVGVPILFRTLRITEPCGRDDHRRFRFTADNSLEYIISSRTDSISGERQVKSFNHGIWVFENGSEVSFGGHSYRVHVRDPNPDADYRFVLLIPIARAPDTVEELCLGAFGVNPRYVHHSSYTGVATSICKSFALRITRAVDQPDPKEPGLLLTRGLSSHYTLTNLIAMWWSQTAAPLPAAAIVGASSGIVFLHLLPAAVAAVAAFGLASAAAVTANGSYRVSVPSAPPLRRLEVAVKGKEHSWSVLVVHRVGAQPITNPSYSEMVNHDYDRDAPMKIDETLLVKIALLGDYTSVTISHSMFMQMTSRFRLTAADAVEQFQWKVPRDRAFLLDFLKDTKGNYDPDSVPFVLLYEASNKRYVVDKCKGVQPLMAPLGVVPPLGADTNSSHNEAKGVKTRIGDIMAGPHESLMSPSLMDHGMEFVGHLQSDMLAATNKKVLEPWPHEAVLDHQTTPFKRLTVERSYAAGDARPLKKSDQAFVKCEVDGGEAAGKIKGEPRIISTKEGDRVKAHYLSYMYALKEVLMILPCSAVGRSVRWVENAVKRVAASSNNGKLFEASVLPHKTAVTNVQYSKLRTFEGDLSRQDGRKSLPWRVIFDKILEAFFTGHYRDEVRALHADTVAMTMRTKTGGEKYGTGFTEGSGMADTTVNNTLENMFIAYHAFRIKGYSPSEAWASTKVGCIFAGDDSCGRDLHLSEFTESGTDMHHVLKYVDVKEDMPLGFLGRKFGPSLRVLRQVVSSIHDPARSIVKFTCCVNKIPILEDRRKRLHDKARAIMTTDRHSFAISVVAKCVLDAGKREYGWTPELNYDLNYNLAVKDEASGETATYSQDECVNDWSEELYRKVWPAINFEALVEYFSADRSFEEIEHHPVFGQPAQCDIADGLTVYSCPLDHTQPVEVVKHGTDEATKIVHKEGKPTKLNPKAQKQYKKEFHHATGTGEAKETQISIAKNSDDPHHSDDQFAASKSSSKSSVKKLSKDPAVFSPAAIAAAKLTKPPPKPESHKAARARKWSEKRAAAQGGQAAQEAKSGDKPASSAKSAVKCASVSTQGTQSVTTPHDHPAKTAGGAEDVKGKPAVAKDNKDQV